MRTVHRMLGGMWMAICCYLFATLGTGIYEMPQHRLDTLAIHLFFVLLYLVGTFASFYLLIGLMWGRIVVGVVALLTVTASVMGLFAFFNSLPFSFVGITFDTFAVGSAAVLFLSRRHVSA
jgi:hypothetical protein